MSIAVKIEDRSNRYRLGILYNDLQSRWAQFRTKENATSTIRPGAYALMTCSGLSVDE